MRRNATTLMQRRMLKSATPANLFASALEVRDFAERLPGRVNRILDALAANDLRLKIEVIDHGSIIDGFQKVANRIALGLVLAALIVGAAMLMRVPTPFTILGYPGLAMLLFLAAAGGGFWMAWTILAGDVRRTKRGDRDRFAIHKLASTPISEDRKVRLWELAREFVNPGFD